MPMPRLRGKTLGVVGFGRIGRAVCGKARAFGMEVLAYSPSLTDADAAPQGARRADLPTLLAQSDYVSIHAPLTPQTDGMIGASELASMKPSAVIINTARGAIVDEDALYDALVAGRIAGAALDVVTQVPPPQHHRLFDLDNVIVTPHTASSHKRPCWSWKSAARAKWRACCKAKCPTTCTTRRCWRIRGRGMGWGGLSVNAKLAARQSP